MYRNYLAIPIIGLNLVLFALLSTALKSRDDDLRGKVLLSAVAIVFVLPVKYMLLRYDKYYTHTPHAAMLCDLLMFLLAACCICYSTTSRGGGAFAVLVQNASVESHVPAQTAAV